MSKGQKKLALYIPGYRNNAVIQLIFFSAVTYITFGISWAIIEIMTNGDELFREYFIPNVALGNAATVRTHFWTFLTYGWFLAPNSFMQLVSNMLWLYCFGSVVQMLIGHRQVAPLYAYAMFGGGLVYMLLVVALPKMATAPYYMGSLAGLVGLAVAAVTLAPEYRFYLSETFTIPLMLVAGVFVVLAIISSGLNPPALALLATGGLIGFGYVKLLKSGYKPGEWIYEWMERLESLVTPKERPRPRVASTTIGRNSQFVKGKVPQRRIDEILDKINQNGYGSLTKEEREMLLQAGKE